MLFGLCLYVHRVVTKFDKSVKLTQKQTFTIFLRLFQASNANITFVRDDESDIDAVGRPRSSAADGPGSEEGDFPAEETGRDLETEDGR